MKRVLTAAVTICDLVRAHRRRAALSVALLLITAVAAPARAQQQQQQQGVVVEKVVAIVNGDGLITLSDLLWQLALQPNVPLENLVRPRSEDLQRALQLMVEQRLIVEESEKLPANAPTEEDVRRELAAFISANFSSQSAFQERIARVGLNSEQLTEIVRRRAAINRYLDFRFRTFAVVTVPEVDDYYKNVYVPQQRRLAPGAVVPALDGKKRAELEEELRETKITSELDAFLEEAAQRAEIIILNPV